ncbi:MAG: hypothetical protein U0Q11_09535 [Vicinamibacterales bacterium]
MTVASQHRPGRRAGDRERDIAVAPLYNGGSDIVEVAEQIERLDVHRGGAVVQFSNLTQLGDELDQPEARLRGVIDERAMPVRQRLTRIALQHAQVAADDRGGRSEFVRSEGQQSRILVDEGRDSLDIA